MYEQINLYHCLICLHQSLTLPLWDGYCKWFWKNVCVCLHDPAVPQELDTHGLPYMAACIHSSKVARMSTHQYFFYYTRSYQKLKKRVRNLLGMASFSLPTSNKHAFYITGCLDDSSFQQSQLESLHIYTSKVIKLTNVSNETPHPLIIYEKWIQLLLSIRRGSCKIQLLYI